MKPNKYMEIVEAGSSASGKTKIWHIKDKGSGEYLGRIFWWARWSQYVMETDEGVIWAKSCLDYISDFIQQQMEAWVRHLRRRWILYAMNSWAMLLIAPSVGK